jgi:hypothetical protein
MAKPTPPARDEQSSRELATILAALRFWQEHKMPAWAEDQLLTFKARDEIDQKTEARFCGSLAGVATNEAEFEPLTEDEIDELCERINCTEKPRVIVNVSGGNVQAARASCDISLAVLDYDNLEGAEKGSDEEKELLALQEEYDELEEAVY